MEKIDYSHNKCLCGEIKYKYAHQCWKCYIKNCKGKKCFHYIDGRAIKIYYCKCGKEIRYRAKRCGACAAKYRLKNPKNHPMWKGGKQQKIRPRNTKKYYNWRKNVFKRDNYTCQVCGQYGGKLEAHHIKSWKNYPKFRYNINNGETRCIKCHPKGK